MATFKHLTFLKVLAIIAWADGQVTESELNILKKLYRKFGLDKDALAALNPYLRAPVDQKEQDRLFKQLVAELSTPGEREEVLAEIHAVAESDGRMAPEEKELLEEFTRLLEKSSITRRSFGRIRNFFQKTLFVPAHEKNPALHQYFKNTVLKKLQVKHGDRWKVLRLDEDRIYFLCLLGTLLASVAHVDDHFHEEEQKALKKILRERFDLKGPELDLVFEVIEEQARRGFDFHEVVTEFNRVCSYNDRVNTVDCFFAIAAADGEISHDESEEIRRITKAMHISHSVFKTEKVKMLKQLRGE